MANPSLFFSLGFGEELPRTSGEEAGAAVHERQEGEAGEEADALGDPAEGKAHQELKRGGDDGDGGLRAAHEVARHDRHQRRLRDDAGNRAAKAKNGLDGDSAYEERHERNDEVTGAQDGDGGDVERHADRLRQLAGEQAAGDRADGPAPFQKAETSSASVEHVVGRARPGRRWR